jgi:hypothetical protein
MPPGDSLADSAGIRLCCRCEERSDEASPQRISQRQEVAASGFALLAMTLVFFRLCGGLLRIFAQQQRNEHFDLRIVEAFSESRHLA